MKTIDIAMIAWPKTPDRVAYMDRTLETIRQNAVASRHLIQLYVSLETLDVSPANFHSARQACAKYNAVPYWRAKPPSLGGNNNDAIMLGHGDFKILNQDDWIWSSPTDISDDADFLDSHPDFAMVRYSTHYTASDGMVDSTPARELFSIHMPGPYPYGGEPHMQRADFATRRSPTNGEPVGFFTMGETDQGNYSDPENNMGHHLRVQGWKVAGYAKNISHHIATASTRPVTMGGVEAY